MRGRAGGGKVSKGYAGDVSEALEGSGGCAVLEIGASLGGRSC